MTFIKYIACYNAVCMLIEYIKGSLIGVCFYGFLSIGAILLLIDENNK